MCECINMEVGAMNYYIEIKKVGIRVYKCTYNMMLAGLALESIALRRTLRAEVIDSDHNLYYVTCRYIKETNTVEISVKEL